MRVLIAEDEALIRMDLREMLEEEGHEVVGEARDGAEAIAAARALKPDVVFMDITMPGTNGIEAWSLRSLRRRWSNRPPTPELWLTW
jgi:DNA-binding NarL/FixJ family response regulator